LISSELDKVVQNLIDWSVNYVHPFHKRFDQYFLSDPVIGHTDKHTDTGESIIAFSAIKIRSTLINPRQTYKNKQ